MGLATTPAFFQHRMDVLLAKYLWKTVIVYIDDILVYSRTLEGHITDLRNILAVLLESGITLNIKKCHFAYGSVEALGHRVGRLGLATHEEKVEAISKLAYPETFQQLEAGIGIFGFYRKYVLGYSVIIEPLEELKTQLLKSAPRKGRQRQNFGSRTSLELNDSHRLAWDQLKKALADAPILAIPDFSKPFILYSDGSKEFGYGIALHQLDEDGKERPVLFLSKRLSPAERNYWATELEVGALVWGISKLRHYLDGNKMTVYTDHTAVKNLFEGTTPTRRNDRLTSWALFLSQFRDNMTITHKPGHVHRNADALSRLQEVYLKDKDGTKVRTEPEPVHLVNVLSMDPALKNSLLKDLPNDKHLGKIYRRLLEVSESDATPGEPRIGKFKLETSSKLLYFCSKDGDRLCIPKSMHQVILTAVHDHKGHPGIAKTYDRLRRSIYMARMRSEAESYVLACPVCNQSKPGRHQPYGQLQPITVPTEPLSVLTMDFVVGLPVSRKGNDAILTITCKFSKAVRIIPGKTTFTAMDWAELFFEKIYNVWGIPLIIISDRDAKFMSEFWQALFRRARVKLGVTSAYHPPANGQSERSNDIIETMFRCFLCQLPDESGWESFIPEVEYFLLTAFSETTGSTPFELLYGITPRSEFSDELADFPSADAFVEHRKQLRQQARDAMQIAQARMAYYYDKKHKAVELKEQAYIRLVRKVGQVGYRLPDSTCLSPLKMGPFKIKRRVGELAYELDLPEDIKIHPVISVIHLEQASDDPWGRQVSAPPTELEQLLMPYEVEGILEKKLRQVGKGSKRRIWQYLVKWKGQQGESWEPASIITAQAPELVSEFEAKHQTGSVENADNVETTNENAKTKRTNSGQEPPAAESNRSVDDIIRDIEARAAELEQMAQPRRKGRRMQG